MRRTGFYIYHQKNWPRFTWDNNILMADLSAVRYMQGKLMGKMEGLGFHFRDEAVLTTLTQDVLKSSEIEGEYLDIKQVRSSIARKLGLDVAGLVRSDRHVDGVVTMMLDATQHYEEPLSKERLFGWHSALFPTGKSGMYTIKTGDWRDDSTGPMQVVSGPLGKEKVHFQAPDASTLSKEMTRFFKWFNTSQDMDPVLKAGLAHVWFVTIHPFDDGNGRMARAIADMQLARADGSCQRFYSMSSQVKTWRKQYYEMLESTQKGPMDVTPWLQWFLKCLYAALTSSDKILRDVMTKAAFWEKHRDTELNTRQRKVLNKLMDGFEGKLSTSKWAKINKCSADTALRDIQDLVQKKILKKEDAGGRSTHYEIR